MPIATWKIVLITLLILVLILLYTQTEGFENRDQKANAVFNWFNTNPTGSYRQYHSDMNGNSNIVEYEDVRQLFQNRNFTVDNVKRVV